MRRLGIGQSPEKSFAAASVSSVKSVFSEDRPLPEKHTDATDRHFANLQSVSPVKHEIFVEALVLTPALNNWLSQPYRAFGKRLLDLCISASALLAVAPLFALIAVLVKLTSRGPAFFVQERLGRGGTTFRAYKFRTMTDRLRVSHQEIFGKADEVTAVGYWLRRFKLDELPQLWNIVNGDMSLVGPRPALPAQLAEYTDLARRRLHVRPGLTGLAQVHGNIHLTWPERWVYDAEYVAGVSFALDVWIIARTIGVVLLGEERFLSKPADHSARRAA